MNEGLARILGDIAGSLLQGGATLAQAELIAKVRAFNRGEWDGEACERCGTMQATLDDWRDGMATVRLCYACSGKEAVYRQQWQVSQRVAGSQIAGMSE